MSSLTTLTSLDLSYCDVLSNVSPVSSLTYLTNLDLSWCKDLDDLRFVSSLVRLQTLNLLDFSAQLADMSLLSSLTSLNALYLGCGDDTDSNNSQLVDVLPLSVLAALETLYLVGCEPTD